MNKLLLVSPLSIVLILIMIVFAGDSLFSFEESFQFNQVSSSSTDKSPAMESTQETTCGSSTESSPHCDEIEQRILSSTLRIVIDTWIIYIEGKGYSSLFSDGHGTVMNGRYLLTHNHFDLPLLELFADQYDGQFATITLYNADGNLLWQGPLTTAAVAYDDSETLLLEFQDEDGQGLFDTLGISSADFTSVANQSIPAGTRVAQVNWDKDQAFVQWTNVEMVMIDGNTPVVSLEACIIGGSSGGGVYLNGVHIANNWSRSAGCMEGSTDASLLYSKAALNSADFLRLSSTKPASAAP